MAKLSRNARQKARVRRNLSLVSRQLRALQTAHLQTHITLLAVLGQAGGEVTLTAGTLQQVAEGIRTLNWQRTVGANEGEFLIKLVTTEAQNVEGDPLPEADGGDTDGAEQEGPAEDGPLSEAEVESLGPGVTTGTFESFPGSSELDPVNAVGIGTAKASAPITTGVAPYAGGFGEGQ